MESASAFTSTQIRDKDQAVGVPDSESILMVSEMENSGDNLPRFSSAITKLEVICCSVRFSRKGFLNPLCKGGDVGKTGLLGMSGCRSGLS